MLNKVVIIIKKSQLSAKELSYIIDHNADFAGFDLNSLPLSNFLDPLSTATTTGPLTPAITINTLPSPLDTIQQSKADINSPALLNNWSALNDFVQFKNSGNISSEDSNTDLIDFFNLPEIQSSPNISPSEIIIDKLVKVTGWDKKSLQSLMLGTNSFKYVNSDLKNIDQLVQLVDCLDLIKRLGVSASQILKWSDLVNKSSTFAEVIENSSGD